ELCDKGKLRVEDLVEHWIRIPLQLWIVNQQRLRRLDTFSRQHVFNLQRIHSRFRFEVIDGNYIRYLSFLRDAFDLLFPATQLPFAVQIVVAVGSFLRVEPLIVIAPVETHVTEL